MPNGIDLILADHRLVDGLFQDFEQTGDATIVGQIVGHLTAHDEAEHAALYPLLGEVLGDASAVERAAAAHSAVKKQIDLLKSLEGPSLTIAVQQLRELVDEHVADEEKRLLPKLAKAATPAQLDWLGAHIEQTKQRVG
jgi:hemerythrin superfamily protein